MATQQPQPSRNVFACKALKCTQAFARGLWNNGVLSPYLFILSNESKTAVGLVQGMFGLATATLALPAGILSDKTARHYVSKLSAVLDAIAIAFTSAAVLSNHNKFHLLCVGALFWGLSVACDSNTDALFADSIPAAERSSQFTQLQALSMACLGAGPLIAAAIFHSQGDKWTLHALGIVILCGMVASIVPLIIKLLVHDKYTLGAEAEAITEFLSPQDDPSQTQQPAHASAAQLHKARPKSKLPVVHSGAELRMDSFPGNGGGSPADSISLVDTPIQSMPSNGMRNGVDNRNPTLNGGVQGGGAISQSEGAVEPPAGHGAASQSAVRRWLRQGSGVVSDRSQHAVRGVAKDAEKSGSENASQEPLKSQPHTVLPTLALPASVHLNGSAGGRSVSGQSSNGQQATGWLQAPSLQAQPTGVSIATAATIDSQEEAAEARLMRAAMLLTQMSTADDCSTSQTGFIPRCCRWTFKPEWIPVLVFSADVVMGLASGMTIKFFPIFFMKKSFLSPMENSLLAASTPVAIASGIFVAQRLSNVVGRVPAILAFRWLGVLLLLVMALARSVWSIKAIILPLYLARTACANCTSALARSILMDFVSKRHRGKWSCLDGVTIFGWSGSAVLGGMLLDRYGFRSVFVATAAMQFAGSMFIVSLLPVVSAFEKALKVAVQEEGPSAGGDNLAPGPQSVSVPDVGAALEYESSSQNIRSVSSFPEEGTLAAAAAAMSPCAATKGSAGGAWLGGRLSPTAHRVSIDSREDLHEPLLPQPRGRGGVAALVEEGSGTFRPRSNFAGYNRQGSTRLSMDGSEEIETSQSFSTITGTG